MTKNISKPKTHIMESVDILDRVDICLFQTVPGHFNVDIVCKEKGKRFVIDDKALETLQHKLIDLCRDKSAAHDNTKGYIQEYVGRLIKEYHKVDLAIIEDIPEGIDDHYSHLRKMRTN